MLNKLPFIRSLSGWIAVIICAGSVTASELNFYVSQDGNDGGSGERATAEPGQSNGPFRTMGAAQSAIRRLKAAGKGGQAVVVNIASGTYFLSEPLEFTPEDSGSAQFPIRYAGGDGPAPVLSGGRRIEGVREITRENRKLWRADLPAVRSGAWFFRELWVNGERRRRARHPNFKPGSAQSYLQVAEVPDANAQSPWHQGQSRFRCAAGDLAEWATLTNAELVVMNRWTESHLPIVRFDAADRMVYSSKRSVFQLAPGDLYYVEHAFEALDEPGEWYLDRAEGALYYAPLPAETLESAQIIAPVLAEVVRFAGRPEKGEFVEHLQFEQLTFAHTEWYFQPGGAAAVIWPAPASEVGGFAQAAIGVPGAVRGEGLRHATFRRCNFHHLGAYGLELARGCQSNRIAECDFGDLAAGGIRIGETAQRPNLAERARDNVVQNCRIHDGGEVFHSAIGVWMGQSSDNQLLHNEIRDFYYSGISVGWTWGYGSSLASNNLIAFNHVHHIGKKSNGDGPILSDMGGIYTLGIQPGTAIINNKWHDIEGLRYGGWGIYFDEGSTHIRAVSNVVYRTTHGGFHQHYGKENIVENNVFAFARDHQIQRTRREGHQSFRFEKNIVYWDKGVLFSGDLGDFQFRFDKNVYWNRSGADISFAGMNFAQWKEKNQDQGSVMADPLFAEVEKDDYRLKAESPALKLGFQPIDLSQVGPQLERRK